MVLSSLLLQTHLCSKCKTEKPIEEFYICKDNKFSGWCKNCYKQYRTTSNSKLSQDKYKSKQSVKDHNKERAKKYRSTYKGRFVKLKTGAKHRHIEVIFTEVEYYKFIDESKACYYCERELNDINAINAFILNYSGDNCKMLKIQQILKSPSGKTTNFTVDRLDSFGPYSKDNCVCCCYFCNQSKGWLIQPEDFKKISKNIISNINQVCIDNGFDASLLSNILQ